MIIKPALLKDGVNHSKGRKDVKIEAIVIHVMEGTMDGTLSWFNNPNSKVSSHYGTSLEGEVVQYVNDEDTAWHAGRVDNPTAQIVKDKPGVNPNLYTIGIENEGFGRIPMPTKQFLANVELVRILSAKHNLPIIRYRIIGHREIYSKKTCPGRIDVDELVVVAKNVDIDLTIKKILKRGDRDVNVMLLQELLVKLGYMTQIQMNTGPGRFGPATEKAFNEFLRNHCS